MAQRPLSQNKLDVVIQGLLGWTCLVCSLGASVFIGGVEPVLWSLMALFFFVLLAVQVVKDSVFGVSRVALSIWPVALSLLIVICWISIQTQAAAGDKWAHPAWDFAGDGLSRISADPISGHHALTRLMLYVSAFWIMLRSAENANRAMLFLQFIALWSCALALFGLWTLAVGSNQIVGAQAPVVTGTFVNRNSYATYAMMGAVTNLGVYIRTMSSGSREQEKGRVIRDFLENFFSRGWIYLGGFLLCVAALLGTQSRAGVASGVLALVVLLLLQRRKGKTILAQGLVVAPILALTLFAALTLSPGVAARFMSLGDQSTSLRFITYPGIVEGIMDRPLLGHGFGAFHDMFRTYVPVEAARLEWDFAHNTYLEMAFEMGIPAAILFYAALTYLLTSIIGGNLRRRRRRVFSNVAISVAAGCASHSLFDFSLQIPAVALLFATLLAIGWAHSQPTKTRPT